MPIWGADTNPTLTNGALASTTAAAIVPGIQTAIVTLDKAGVNTFTAALPYGQTASCKVTVNSPVAAATAANRRTALDAIFAASGAAGQDQGTGLDSGDRSNDYTDSLFAAGRVPEVPPLSADACCP